jgi:nucleotide-binding universal stress UspA family protein
MALKDLLLHVDLSEASRHRTEMAIALARRHEAHLAALCLVASPYLPAMAGVAVPADTLGAQLRAAEEEATALLGRVREQAEAAGVAVELRQESAPIDRLPQILALQARHADLAIVGQPNPEIDGLDDALLAEAAFMNTGRPALVVPYIGARVVPPERVMVCWDGGRESVRAANDALPLMRRAQRVVVLVVDPEQLTSEGGSYPGAAIATHLARHGVTVEVKVAQSGGLKISDVLLGQAADDSADLIVMGAFGHSRLRELIMGGTTREIMKYMTVPVLFSH